MSRTAVMGRPRRVPTGPQSPSNIEAGGHEPLPFEQRYRRALSDAQLQRNLLNFQRSWREGRDAAWAKYAADSGDVAHAVAANEPPPANDIVHLAHTPGNEEFALLRNRLAAIKDDVIERLPEYVDIFQAAAERNGVKVYRARDAEEANNYVLKLCRDKGISHVVKSKTMVSEETFLNAALEENDIKVVETDLGEWIVQLAHEKPSHMVMPAIHKSRGQVGEIFTRTTGRPVSDDDIPEQVSVARTELRADFLGAGLGVSGANALIAESGSVMFICNEGNARLVTSLPRTHVVLAGIEKLVPNFAAAMLQLRLLARSATAQSMTSYSTFVSGPSEPDKEMHIVLVDNGRMQMRENPLIKEALRCIRCAACANVCPPYAVVGGHVFGYIYTGAIGLVNTPYHHGIDAAAGPQGLCVSCNACATVCPVGIPLPQQILAVRAQVVEKKGLPWPVRALMSGWSQPRTADLAFRAAAQLSRPLSDGRFTRIRRVGAQLVPKVRALTSWRTPPALATKPYRSRISTASVQPAARSTQAPIRVAYFIQCITDRFFPEMAESIVQTLEACGVEVITPSNQHCCGLPALDAGDLPRARRMARQTIETLEAVQADYILTGGTSCAIAMLYEYEGLFEGFPKWQRRARSLTKRIIDFTSFMDKVAQLDSVKERTAGANERIGPVTYHNFCQSANILGLEGASVRIIRDVLGLELRDLPEGSVCCGFGGSTSLTHPEVAAEILKRKLENVQSTGAKVLVTDNPGCILHMRGGIDAAGLNIRVLHIAELVAEALG